MIWVIWLTILIDGKAAHAMPITSESFSTWATCTYYAIDAKNQMGILLKDNPLYTVEWECKRYK